MANGLEYAYGDKIHAEERQAEAEAAEESCSEGDNIRVFHKGIDDGAGSDGEEDQDGCHQGDNGFDCEHDGIFHAFAVVAGIVVADQGHDTLGKSYGYLEGDHIYFLGDAHGGYGMGAEGGGEVV